MHGWGEALHIMTWVFTGRVCGQRADNVRMAWIRRACMSISLESGMYGR